MRRMALALSLLPVLGAPAHAEQGSSATLEALEARIKVLEASVSAPPPGAEAAPAGGSSANAFNPAISLVLNGSYAQHSLHPDDYLRAGFRWWERADRARRGCRWARAN